METYTELKSFRCNPQYKTKRQDSLRTLDITSIDTPIVDLVKGFSKLSFCFTLQSCFGHFLHGEQKDPRNIERLVDSTNGEPVEYRIAYLALCIEDSDAGKVLFEKLGRVTEIDPSYIQFGCAEWFWERQNNSYVLQVEPKRHRDKDSITIGYGEALRIQDTRDRFFLRLQELLGSVRG
ncbi:MAG: hypothetical protein JXQ30_12150 [Spirochaetes bacterium]|nr:hypothetical protein [Spirochaetota bacterium]